MQEYNEIKTRFFFFEDMNLASESIKHDDINQIRESNKIEKKGAHMIVKSNLYQNCVI